MQFGRAAHQAILEIGDDNSAVAGASLGVAPDKTIAQKAVEAIMTAGGIQPQQMVAQQPQLVSAQGSYAAFGKRRPGHVVVAHVVKNSSEKPSRRRRIPRPEILCIAT